MECSSLEITIQYAEDLNKVNFISKMDVYVVVSISGGDESSKQKTKTPVSHGGDANPAWRFPMKFTVEEAAMLQNRLMLDFEIRCVRALGDRVIGEVHVPVKELLDYPAKGYGAVKNFITYQVMKPGGRPQGKLTFSYQFRGKTAGTSAKPPPAAAAEAAVHGGPTITYPVVEPSSPYMLSEMVAYSLIPPENALVPPPLPSLEEPTSPYPAAKAGLYPPIYFPTQPVAIMSPEFGGGQYPPPLGYHHLLGGGSIEPERYPPPVPPVMQLAPDWWIVDWRYDARCTGF